MSDTRTPEQRSLAARIAAHAKHANTDGIEATRVAREAGPAGDDYWLRVVDADGKLSPKERAKRARNAKAEHFTRLALKSAKVRAEKAGQ